MGRIPDRLIQDVLDKTDIVSIIGDYVRLTKKSGRWVGLCPFHSEKSPSFNVDPDKGLITVLGARKAGLRSSFSWNWRNSVSPRRWKSSRKRQASLLKWRILTSDEKGKAGPF